jgi:membrane dipeptidase
MQESGMILDISHFTDEALWEAFDIWEGPIMASHCVCRSLVQGQRHLTDEMIQELIRRGGIIGLVFCQYFIEPEINWQKLPRREAFTPKRTMRDLVPHVEHIGNLAGGSLENIAIGSDLDGGFGKELAPLDLDTVADLVKFGQVLEDCGYSNDEADGILSGNAVRFFRESWD